MCKSTKKDKFLPVKKCIDLLVRISCGVGMKRKRIKASGGAVYHCISRVVGGERLLGEREKEVFRKQLWQVADFCGVRVLTYCLMSNHIHVLVDVPDRTEVSVSDAELMRRYRVLYPKPTAFQVARAEALEEILKEGGKESEAIREGLLARMHDVSEFMKTLKQRFSRWYNKTHSRFGTLWAERFNSVLVEGRSVAARTVAAYIDLNPVRAGMVKDPADYRWCGYGEAMGGGRTAREGLCEVQGYDDWSRSRTLYRQCLFSLAAVAARGKSGSVATVDQDTAYRVVHGEKGELPVSKLMGYRVRYFTQGLAIGSREFVSGILDERFRRKETKLRHVPKRFAELDGEELVVGRGLRVPISEPGADSDRA